MQHHESIRHNHQHALDVWMKTGSPPMEVLLIEGDRAVTKWYGPNRELCAGAFALDELTAETPAEVREEYLRR